MKLEKEGMGEEFGIERGGGEGNEIRSYRIKLTGREEARQWDVGKNQTLYPLFFRIQC
jgi:hypothetical protein